MVFFSYIVAVSFIGGGNQSIRRKPLTCRKSLYISVFLHVFQGNYDAFDNNKLTNNGRQ